MMSKKETYDYQEQAQKIWEMYQKGIEYQETSGLSELIPKCVDFYEGRQWPEATENTKTFPRPVINITRMICRNKKAGILSNKTSFVYSCDDSNKSKTFTRFSNYICKELGQEKLDRTAVGDGCVKGTYIYHYYWDNDALGKRGNVNGGIRGEIIDPLNIFFENPNNNNEQTQKWIIIRSRLSVDTVKAMKDVGVDENLISNDSNESKYNEKEQDETNRCTVLTRYFKKNGEVYYEKSTKSTVIVRERPLRPDMEMAKKLIGKEDVANEQGFEEAKTKPDVKAYLYPVAVGSYEQKDKSIFGIGEVEGIIPNQKSINFNLGLQLLNIQSVWGGKYVVHPTALRGQQITNNPGQVLVDYSGTGSGIKKITEQVYNDVPLKVLDSTMGATRVVTGATEVMTGETIGANTSGAAILQLQSQALKPIEELQQAFWDTKAKCGKILEMFYKLYYEDTNFSYNAQNDNGVDTEKVESAIFNGSEYGQTDFDVAVEVVSGAKGSEVSLVNALDNLLQQKQIDITTYFELYPHNALPNKAEIVDAIKQREQAKIYSLEAKVQEQEQQLANASKIFEQSRETIQKAVNALKENQQLKETIVNMQNEFAEKINLANLKINETTGDAQKLAEQIFYANQQQK